MMICRVTVTSIVCYRNKYNVVCVCVCVCVCPTKRNLVALRQRPFIISIFGNYVLAFLGPFSLKRLRQIIPFNSPPSLLVALFIIMFVHSISVIMSQLFK